MLDIKRVLSSAKSHERADLRDLRTPWGAEIDPARVLPEHPRPQLARDSYTTLNGIWDVAIEPLTRTSAHGTDALDADEAIATIRNARPPASFDASILVPFSPEAPLSGVKHVLTPHELLWYRRRLSVAPIAPDDRLMLHLEAVDWACAVFADGHLAATHIGGYLPIDIDLTPFVGTEKTGAAGYGRDIELIVCVYDPTDAGVQPRGKQRLAPGGIWYTPQSGIWQSVWWELVPAAHIRSCTLEGDMDGTLTITAEVDDAHKVLGPHAALTVLVTDPVSGARWQATLSAVSSESDGTIHGSFSMPHAHLWSPDDPHLYDVELTLAPDSATCRADAVRTSCAFRRVQVAPDAEGIARFMLNGKPLLLKGVLDQGYWPDGLMTAPADEALVFDILAMKRAGFNMLRKHIKIESARWYHHCDRLGMLVWQDAVSGGSPYSLWHTSRKPTLFKTSWGAFRDDMPRHRRALSADDERYRREWTETCEAMVRLLAGHPSVVTWVLFNEGWGQFDASHAAERVHRIDPSRPIDAVSGWYDQRCGDYLSRHNYFRSLTVDRRRGALHGYAAGRGCRAFVISEFGGFAQLTAGHTASSHPYGYGGFATAGDWRGAVHGALAHVESLEPQGLAGYVYTQLSDVEEELNGILTYDRRVNKLKDGDGR